eukprot:14718715-Ditylum_brightwellii.AAC.1
MQKVQRNISCIAIQPIACPVHVVGDEVDATCGKDDDVPNVVTLSPNLNNSYILWQEYEHGIGDRNLACHFLQSERGHKK